MVIDYLLINEAGTVAGKTEKQIKEVVDITSPAYNSMQGRYFIGQTEVLTFGGKDIAWSGIFNPVDSGVNLYFDIFTITNFSKDNFLGEIWLNARFPKKGKISATVTPSNQSITPPPKPKAVMQYSSLSRNLPDSGVNIFGRIVPQNSTLVSDSHKGSMIIGPGNSFVVLLKSLDSETATGTIVLTWWEEKV